MPNLTNDQMVSLGRLALTAVLSGIALFVGSWFVIDPWPGTANEDIKALMLLASPTLVLAALVLGVLGWRSYSGRVAIGLVLTILGLTIFLILNPPQFN